MMPRVPFIRPTMPEAGKLASDFESISAANWYTNFGPQEQAFRRGISSFIGNSPDVVTVANATTGIMTALAALLPRGEGAESIATASFTFAAGAQAVLWHGYRPAWIDIDLTTLQPSLDSLFDLMQRDPSIKAILLTNSFGIGNPRVPEWEAAAAAHGIPLIIDSAPGFGSEYPSGELLGTRGNCEIFSFHATKPFAIGEGGAVVTRDASLAERIREITNFGFHGKPAEAVLPGLNGKLQEINAAIGLRQLANFDNTLRERRRLLSRYAERLDGSEFSLAPGAIVSSGGFAPIVVADSQRRDAALEHLDDAGVDARSYYSPPVHSHHIFQRFQPLVDLRNSEDLARRMISLPVLPGMTDDEFDRVCSAVEESVERV
ncbi:DegT/DnrJ/EryC1/StrS family aminotransferase [Leucobacter sp. W1038]|uniref:DegT/DnrJ/EryC1/StrS family aminotransferase n=1 Tax=Leucobacter sp. W1038 TaxID=3438281 RepID=UPI003D97FC72